MRNTASLHAGSEWVKDLSLVSKPGGCYTHKRIAQKCGVAEGRNQAGRFALGSPGSWWVTGGRLWWRQGWGWGVAASKKDPMSTYLDTAWQNLLTTTLTSISFQYNSFPPQQYIQWLQNLLCSNFFNLFFGCTGSSFLGIGLLWLQSPVSVVALGLSCSIAHGIFLDQGSKPFPLRWQADP